MVEDQYLFWMRLIVKYESASQRPPSEKLPGEGIPLKTTQVFLKIFLELYSAILKPICESSYF